MNYFFTLLIGFFSITVSAQLNYNWHLSAGDATAGNYYNNLTDMETDDSDFVYTTGTAYGTIDLDNGPGTALVSSPGLFTAFVAVYDEDGNYVRSWIIETNNNSQINNICIAGNGDVIAVGSCTDTTDFDPGPAVSDAPSAGAFIARYTKYGQLIWVHVIPSTWNKYIGWLGVDEENGRICAGGAITVPQNDSLDIDPGPGVHYAYFTPHCGTGALMALDSNGNYLVSVIPAGSYIYAVRITSFGEMIATGGVNDTIDFNPGPLTYLYIPKCYPCPYGDFCVMRYSATGSYIWHYASGSVTSESVGGNVQLDAAGNIYVSGSGAVDVNPGPLVQYVYSPFVIKFLSNGQYAWHKFGGCFDIDENDYVYIYDSSNNNLSCYNAAGTGYWSMYYPATDAYMLRTSPGGNILLAGANRGNVDYDPGPNVAIDPPWTSGSSWFVVALHHLYAATAEHTTNNTVAVYPNPANDYLTVTDEQGANSTFSIVNSLGAIVLSGTTTGTTTRVDITALPPGTYYLRLDGEEPVTLAFVIVR